MVMVKTDTLHAETTGTCEGVFAVYSWNQPTILGRLLLTMWLPPHLSSFPPRVQNFFTRLSLGVKVLKAHVWLSGIHPYTRHACCPYGLHYASCTRDTSDSDVKLGFVAASCWVDRRP